MKHKPPEVNLGSHSRARCPSATPSGPPLPLGFVLKAPGWGRLLAPQRFPLPRVQGLTSGQLGCQLGSQDADYPRNTRGPAEAGARLRDSISQRAARRSGRVTPARPQSGRELRFPEGGARASAARIGPIRVCGGWTSGVRGLSLCSGARGHTGVGDPSAAGPGGVQEGWRPEARAATRARAERRWAHGVGGRRAPRTSVSPGVAWAAPRGCWAVARVTCSPTPGRQGRRRPGLWGVCALDGRGD